MKQLHAGWMAGLVAGVVAGLTIVVVAEEIEVTTVYPSPRGVYDQLQANELRDYDQSPPLPPTFDSALGWTVDPSDTSQLNNMRLSDLNLAGDFTVGGNLTVIGTSTLTGDVTLGGELTCTDCITLGAETVGGYAGSASEGGAATTALALDALPTQCPARRAPRGIEVDGDARNCGRPEAVYAP